MSFEQLNLNTRIQNAVEDAGYTKPTEIQQKAIPAILTGKDVIGIAQTGTGKTAAFTLPLLSQICEQTGTTDERHTRLLIIAPTRELVAQINESIRTYGKYTNLRTATVTGGASEQHQIEKLASGVDIVIATPGRLLALQEANKTHFGKLTHLILDEADRMLDMGFLPDIIEILKPLPNKRQTLLFSATLSKPIQKLANQFLIEPKKIEVGKQSNPAQTVNQTAYPVPQHLKGHLLLKLLESHEFFAVIVFVRRRIDADFLTKALRKEKLDVDAIHGDCSQNHRFRALRDFKNNKLRVLVATDVAARGLDIDGVTHVVNYDFPESSEDYIHRIGRTGRAGNEGFAVTFLTPQDERALSRLEKHIGRTLSRKTVDDFDYDAPAPEGEEQDTRPSRRPQGRKPKQQTRSGYTSQDGNRDHSNKRRPQRKNAPKKRGKNDNRKKRR